MTGPRSTGCITCVKRKVKCDEKHPICDRCAKAKIECRGYARTATFIIEQGSRSTSSRSSRIRNPEKHQQLVTRSNATTDKIAGLQVPSKGICLSAFSNNIFVSFLLNRLIHDVAPTCGNIWSLTHPSPQLTSSMALDALATMFFARTHGELSLVEEATRKYGVVLHRFKDELMSSRAWSFDTLKATTAFSMYEMIVFTRENAWSHHAEGLSKLMEMRGPETYQQNPYKDLFVQNRVFLISEALMAERRTYLSEPAWKDVPWATSRSSKTRTDYLFDIMSDIAGLRQDAKSLPEGIDTLSADAHKYTELCGGIWNCFRDLNAWWREWLPLLGMQHRSVTPDPKTTLCLDDAGLFFDRHLEFDSFWTCFLFMSHNGARILLLEMCKTLGDRNPLMPAPEIPPEEPNATTLLGVSHDPTGLAYEVIQCVDYCQAQSRQFIGVFLVVFPLYIVGDHFPHHSREMDWFCEVCRFDNSPLLSGFLAGPKRIAIERFERPSMIGTPLSSRIT